MTNWSPQQQHALDEVSHWHKACMAEIANGSKPSKQVMRVFGYAGTGKTTLARHFADSIDGDTCYAAFTGKAAMVMRKNKCRGAKTLHSLIYSVEQDHATGSITFKWDADSDASTAALICIDECSMVNDDLGGDLLRYGRPVLVLGDPAQLPPVKSTKERQSGGGAGFFTDQEPDVMLTEIHRQARDNPIIHLATEIREGRSLPRGGFDTSMVLGRGEICPEMVLQADQVLIGRNNTRETYNRRIRQLKGFDDEFPTVGERLVCLKNDRSTGIFNGGMFEVAKTKKQTKRLRNDNRMAMGVRSLDFTTSNVIDVECPVQCWTGGLAQMDWRDKKGTQEFDYGYALTVHKSQGSQWDHVMLFDESGVFRDDWRKWLYTGITRAAERITIVSGS
jgi:ATP-dependent exoDNAse (exonuclease V) alpha subunit